jgi:hypothetical protein
VPVPTIPPEVSRRSHFGYISQGTVCYRT